MNVLSLLIGAVGGSVLTVASQAVYAFVKKQYTSVETAVSAAASDVAKKL